MFSNRTILNSIIFTATQKRLIYTKKKDIYKKCFTTLGLEDDADQDDVRKAYIALVKKFHPDSGYSESSSEKFQEVDKAFRILQEKFAASRRGLLDDEENNVLDIKHTAPQHRQYLSFDGIGYGTPFQRQKQYQNAKAMKAQERVLEHRVGKSQIDDRLPMKNDRTHKIKTKYGFDRIVEDLIQEAMAKGDFDNLSGIGKPLKHTQTQNPYIDFTTHKLNTILIDNGFTPKWITLQRDIRNEVQILTNDLIEERKFLGTIPLSVNDSNKWEQIIAQSQSKVDRVNKMIDDFNLIVPILDNQMFRIKLEQLAQEILQDSTLQRSERKISTVKKENKPISKLNIFSFLGSLF